MKEMTLYLAVLTMLPQNLSGWGRLKKMTRAAESA